LSKIFDALRKAQGEVASLALPLIEGAGAAAPGTDQRKSAAAPQSLYTPGLLKAEPKQLPVEQIHVENLARLIFTPILRARLRISSGCCECVSMSAGKTGD